jgi:hypothetical protein
LGLPPDCTVVLPITFVTTHTPQQELGHTLTPDYHGLLPMDVTKLQQLVKGVRMYIEAGENGVQQRTSLIPCNLLQPS